MIVKTRTNVYDFNFHLVWVTKYRKEIFTTIEKQNAMQDILTHICDEHNIVIQSLQVMPDHIHMLISFNPKHAASSIVKTLKGKICTSMVQSISRNKSNVMGWPFMDT